MNETLKQKNNKLIKQLLCIILFMFGFCFALVPIYSVFCKVTGINGKTDNTVVTKLAEKIVGDRWVTVQFVAHIRTDMPWVFEPKIKKVKIHPGQSVWVSFYVKNLSDQFTVGQAIPSVSPGLGALYFSKLECFCFNQQPLAAHEEADLGLVFYLNPDLPEDIHTLTLSYTMFNITDRVKTFMRVNT